MNWVIVLGLVYLCQAEHFLYESETGVALQNIVGKDVDINIKFKKAFTRIPKIAYAVGLLDMSGSTFMSEILNVNQEGFTIRVKGDHIDQISYNWMASDNPLIHVQYVKSSEAEIQLPLLSDSESVPLVNSYIVGATFNPEQRKEFNQEIVDLNKDFIKIQTNGASEYKLCLVISNFDNSFKTDDLGLIVDAEDHSWLSTSKDSAKVLVSEYEIPSDIVDYVSLMGISGFSALNDRVRVEVNEEQEQDNHIKVEFGTWDESTIKSLSFYGFYVGNEEVKYFDKNCAYLFSECDFQGQEVKICNNQAKLQYQGQVKSIKLPKDAVFTLYGKEDFDGKKHRIEKTQSCMDALYIGK